MSERWLGIELRPELIALGVLIALKIILLFTFTWHSRFVMDEFVQLGWAKYFGNGLFDTLWPAKAVGYAVFFDLAHVIGWDATSILLIGRIQTALLGLATLAIVYGCARSLGESRLRSLAIILILLCFSNFIERVFRTIAEPLAVFFAAAALLAVLRGRADRARTILAAGMLSGLSFLATQKAVYFNVALGLALVGDAALARNYADGVKRGAWLVLGWLVPIILYCLAFGGGDPLAVARNLVFGPVEVATNGANAYGNLRFYVKQTVLRNTIPYIFCVIGMLWGLLHITKLEERKRIALIFTIVITGLVFAHNQPWPYVFLMALPFMALWSLAGFDALTTKAVYRPAAWAVLGIAIAASFGRNLAFLQIDNRSQLQLVGRAESLVGPADVYFDGVGMLPNRREPSTLWLDRHYRFKTLHEGQDSEAYKIFAESPPKVILWSIRMDEVEPVLAPLIRNSYVQVAPNIRVAGQRLLAGEQVRFNVPVAGTYALYSSAGEPLQGEVEVNGLLLRTPIRLAAGGSVVRLLTGPREALLLPARSYRGHFAAGADNKQLFADVYN